MNRILKASSLSASLLLSAAAVAQSGGPKVQTPADVMTRADAIRPAVVGSRPPKPSAVPFLKVHPRQDAAGCDREIQAMAAQLIGRQAEEDRSVAEGRARRFKPRQSPPILGWRGEILDMAIAPAGPQVRVRGRPDHGAWCAIGGRYYTDETYLIKDGVADLTAIEPGDPSRPPIFTCN